MVEINFDDMKQQVRDKHFHAKSYRSEIKYANLFEEVRLYEQLYKTQFGPAAKDACANLIKDWFEMRIKK